MCPMMEKFFSLSDFVNFALFFIKAVSVTLTAFSVQKQAENGRSGGDEVVQARILEWVAMPSFRGSS